VQKNHTLTYWFTSFRNKQLPFNQNWKRIGRARWGSLPMNYSVDYFDCMLLKTCWRELLRYGSYIEKLSAQDCRGSSNIKCSALRVFWTHNQIKWTTSANAYIWTADQFSWVYLYITIIMIHVSWSWVVCLWLSDFLNRCYWQSIESEFEPW